MEYKTCNRCSTNYPKTLEYFHARQTSPDKLGTVCKICTKLKKKRDIQHWNQGKLLCLKCKTYKETTEFGDRSNYVHRFGKNSRCKACTDEQRIRRRKTSRGHLTLRRLFVERWQGIRDRSKAHNYTLDFDYPYLQELWDLQQGKCAISNMEMTYVMGHGRIPTNVSVDRKDSALGYTKSNTQLVCMAVNQMKSDLTYDELLKFCYKIIETRETRSN